VSEEGGSARPPAPPAGEIFASGARVVVRAPRAADAEAFVAATRASTSLHRSLVTPPATSEAFATYLARCGEPDFCGMLACSREGGEIVGVVNLSQIFYGPFCNAFLGYYAFTPHAGRGYLTEAVGLGLEHAFGPLHLHRVEANVQPDNAHSLALLRRLGFRREGYSPRYLKVAGRWRDHERFAILAEEWQED